MRRKLGVGSKGEWGPFAGHRYANIKTPLLPYGLGLGFKL